jgi:microcystin degradation protein MlrC
MLRVAIAGLSNESCSFSPVPSSFADFQFVRGQELRARYPFLAAYPDIAFVPLLRVRAIPGGPVGPAVFRAGLDELIPALREGGPWDGVYLEMHGATFVAGMEDAESVYLKAVREAVGPHCVIAASYDLHGNVSEAVIRQLDILTAYRTAPHIDVPETCERAVRLLVEALRSGERPYIGFVRVPVLLPGEKTATEWEPGRSLYAALPGLIDGRRVTDASILVGYAWADEPRSSASMVALGHDPDAVQEAVTRLARAYWEARHAFQFGSAAGEMAWCVQTALNSPATPVFISDSGDNITAGGAGDVNVALRTLLESNVRTAAYISMVDPESVAVCAAAGIGAEVALQLGGKRDSRFGGPLNVSARVLRIQLGGPENRHGVVQIGPVTTVITERRSAFLEVSQLFALGIDPAAYQIVCVKLGYLSPEFKAAAALSLLALTPGAVDQRLESLPFQRVGRPIFPLDPDLKWEVPRNPLLPRRV